jgi:hypothetical protein
MHDAAVRCNSPLHIAAGSQTSIQITSRGKTKLKKLLRYESRAHMGTLNYRKMVKISLYCPFKLCNILHIFNIRFWRCKRTYASLCIGHVLISFIQRHFPLSLCSQCNGADQVKITITCINIFLSIVTLDQTNFYCLPQYLLDVSNHLKAVQIMPLTRQTVSRD